MRAAVVLDSSARSDTGRILHKLLSPSRFSQESPLMAVSMQPAHVCADSLGGHVGSQSGVLLLHCSRSRTAAD